MNPWFVKLIVFILVSVISFSVALPVENKPDTLLFYRFIVLIFTLFMLFGGFEHLMTYFRGRPAKRIGKYRIGIIWGESPGKEDFSKPMMLVNVEKKIKKWQDRILSPFHSFEWYLDKHHVKSLQDVALNYVPADFSSNYISFEELAPKLLALVKANAGVDTNFESLNFQFIELDLEKTKEKEVNKT